MGRLGDPALGHALGRAQASAPLSSKALPLRLRSVMVVMDFKDAAMAWPKRNMT